MFIIISSRGHGFNNVICNTSHIHTGALQLNVLSWKFFLWVLQESNKTHPTARRPNIERAVGPALVSCGNPQSIRDPLRPHQDLKSQLTAVCQRTHSRVRCSRFLQWPGALNLQPFAHSSIALRSSSHINENDRTRRLKVNHLWSWPLSLSSLHPIVVAQPDGHPGLPLGIFWHIIVTVFVLGRVKSSSDTPNSRVLWVPGSRFCLTLLSSFILLSLLLFSSLPLDALRPGHHPSAALQ